MPVKSGKCVKTGAEVLILEYGCIARGDLFLVGDTVIFNSSQRIPDECEFPKMGRPLEAPFELTIGMVGYCHDIKGTIVIPRSQLLKGELVGAA